ncbi:hypothetical protein MNB_SV-14-1759 [hydrothermal vent metagenome]|uniref:Outer membrane protein beta-barrel domain-containing protein n=1 Tax=hydrothermal vent metagenome TaxID=652676 RepID=A0A1W1C0B6_9ZZZZ
MKNLKKTLASLLILSSLSTAGTFEQNGVKEGNNRISASARLTFPDEGDKSIQLLGQYGRFLTDDVEVMVDLFSNTASGDTFYLVGLGANYYFAKTPTLTPYVGAEYYYSDYTKDDGIDYSANGTRAYVGAHQFLTENFAITPEAGAQFFDFSDYSQSYLNVYLTYFFD